MSKKSRKKSPKTASKAKSSAKPAVAKTRVSRTLAQGRIENVKIPGRRTANSGCWQGSGCE